MCLFLNVLLSVSQCVPTSASVIEVLATVLKVKAVFVRTATALLTLCYCRASSADELGARHVFDIQWTLSLTLLTHNKSTVE